MEDKSQQVVGSVPIRRFERENLVLQKALGLAECEGKEYEISISLVSGNILVTTESGERFVLCIEDVVRAVHAAGGGASAPKNP